MCCVNPLLVGRVIVFQKDRNSGVVQTERAVDAVHEAALRLLKSEIQRSPDPRWGLADMIRHLHQPASVAHIQSVLAAQNRLPAEQEDAAVPTHSVSCVPLTDIYLQAEESPEEVSLPQTPPRVNSKGSPRKTQPVSPLCASVQAVPDWAAKRVFCPQVFSKLKVAEERSSAAEDRRPRIAGSFPHPLFCEVFCSLSLSLFSR